MRLDFLSASDGTRLTKIFEETAPGRYKIDSYPHVHKFNSFHREVETLEEFYNYLIAHAGEGLCLSKGVIKTQLESESRAGSTDAHAVTEWLCLDVDIPIDCTPGEFLDSLDPSFRDVSYIAQASASQGITSPSDKWRGHIYLLVKEELSPQALKPWLIDRNLEVDGLAEHLELSAGGFALRYPLDITTCQNDKLIYISPPSCTGFDDPIKETRYQLVKRGSDRALFRPSVSAASVSKRCSDLIRTLRSAAGLEIRKAKLSAHASGVEVLRNPDPITVTGKKEARGFVYLNLNSGDSWAYYFPVDNAEILFNFKGEPALYLRDVDQELWKEYSQPVSLAGESVSVASFKPFVCRSAPRDVYYNGIYREDTKSVELYPAASKGKLKDFLAQYGLPMEDYVSDWDVVFEPTSDRIIDFDRRWINTYKASRFTKAAKRVEDADIPPLINRVLDSLCGNLEVKEHFINWLAYLFQTREKIGTAWVFQGVQGTGKGLLFSSILQPILGYNQCYEITMDRFDDQFNNYLEQNVLLFVDEANVADSRSGDRTLNKLKNLITENDIIIRAMRANPISARNYSNLIFASNQVDIIPIEESDRRFNIAPRQDKPINITHEEVQGIQNELSDFANYLYSYSASLQKARKIILNQARDILIQAGRTTVATFFAAIERGKLDYFTQFIREKTPTDLSGLMYIEYEQTVLKWVANAGKEEAVSRDELQRAYNYLQMVNTQMSPTKFSRMCAKYGLNIEPIRTANGVIRGLRDHVWHLSDTEKEALGQETDISNVTPIKA